MLLDFVFTIVSIKLGYAVEINPVVNFITPYGAFALNVIIIYFLSKKFTIIGFLLVLFWLWAYGVADLNHLQLFMSWLI